jgi:hypothetical protein
VKTADPIGPLVLLSQESSGGNTSLPRATGHFQKGKYTLFATVNQSFFFFSQNLSASGGNAPLGIKNRSFPDSAGHHRAYKYNKNIPAYLAKGNFMTKMQIIAKVVLTFLGLSAFVNCCHNLTMMTSSTQAQDTSVLRDILFSLFVIILLIAIVYLLIIKNDWLVRKMAGSGEKLDPESETLWLAGSLRMVAVLYGLILLRSSIVTILNIFALPFYLRPLVNETFTFGTFPKSLAFTFSQWSSMVYNFLQTTLAVYLLYGWPHFIRFQLNLHKSKSLLDQELNTEGIKNE